MPASMTLKAVGLLGALGILVMAVLWEPEAPSGGLYSATVKLSAGASMVVGSLFLSHTIGATFLQSGGIGAFKALYLASLASEGAGAAEAASGLIAVNVPLALSAAILSFSGAGLLLLVFPRGGG